MYANLKLFALLHRQLIFVFVHDAKMALFKLYDYFYHNLFE